MNRGEAIANVEDFLRRVRLYAVLLDESSDPIPLRVVTNNAQVDAERAELAQQYAGLEECIKKFGRDPRMNDGVWNVVYSPYENAFSSDTLARVQPSINAVIDDLNFALGRLKAASDQEFSATLQRSNGGSSEGAFWMRSNPIWLVLQFLRLLWRHKNISGICTVIIAPLLVAYFLHLFGWH